GVDREYVRDVGAVGLVRTRRRLFVAVTPVEEHAAGVPAATDVVPAEDTVRRAAWLARAPQAAAADVADGVLRRASGDGVPSDAQRAAGPFVRVVGRGAR